MIQKQNELQKELIVTQQWKEELGHKQKYEEAAYNPDKEKLLRWEMARLRLKLKLGRTPCPPKRETEVNDTFLIL